MNSNKSESHSSVHTFRVPLSIRSETRDKFNALLLKAANKKGKSKSVSKEKLLEADLQSTTASSENLQDNDVEKFEPSNINEQSKNYILNKFLEGQTAANNRSPSNDNIASIEDHNKTLSNTKPPVPKPRKRKPATTVEKISSPTVSQGTFEVTYSPKVTRTNEPVNDTSVSSNKTYNVEEVGDVLIHDKCPPNSKIIVKTEKVGSVYLEKADTETQSDKTDSKNQIQESEKENELRKQYTEKSDNITDSRSISTNLTRNEIREKSKKKTRKEQNKLNTEDKDQLEVKGKKLYNYEKLVEIMIHKTDRLELNSFVIHPVVKIHVVDITTGQYFPKSDRLRPVVFFYENKECHYISPVMTHTYNLQEKRILFPCWEEVILFNEDFEYFMDESSQIILFFEILDFMSFSDQLNQKSCKKGWHHIAFAFLKLVARNGVLNSGKNLRLQLYRSFQPKKDDSRICYVWTWWKNGKLEKYPSTLYVTVKSAAVPSKLGETHRSKTPIQGETSSRTKLCEDLKKEIPEIEPKISSNTSEKQFSETTETTEWSRKPEEICKLPNKCLITFESSEDGCFVMKFSNHGLYLACAVHLKKLFYIKIFSVKLLKEVTKFPSHQGMIYDLRWSKDDALIVSASADNTIAIFTVSNNSLLQILPHPSFVYSCDINQEKAIISGCFDGTLRVWNLTQIEIKSEFCLSQELEGHTAYITSVTFVKKSKILSADAAGVINEWSKTQENNWKFNREILILDLKQTIINQILLFPKGKKILVHSRDSIIRIVDLKSGCVLQWLRGSLNKRFQTFCGISPCGTYIYSGGENGYVHAWNSKNGQEMASFSPYSSENQIATVHCVECHPFDNLIAISHYGANLPILFYCHDKNTEQTQTDITITETKDSNVSNALCKFKNFNSKETKYKEGKCDLKEILQKMDQLINSSNSG